MHVYRVLSVRTPTVPHRYGDYGLGKRIVYGVYLPVDPFPVESAGPVAVAGGPDGIILPDSRPCAELFAYTNRVLAEYAEAVSLLNELRHDGVERGDGESALRVHGYDPGADTAGDV